MLYTVLSTVLRNNHWNRYKKRITEKGKCELSSQLKPS